MNATEALQAALAAEHAAVFVYGVVGGRLAAGEAASDRLSAARDPRLTALVQAAYQAHVELRDRLWTMVAARGATPTPAALSYEVPLRRSAEQLAALARRTEVRCAEVYAQLVASSNGPARRLGVEALRDAAVRQVDLGAAPRPYPGLREL